MATKTRTGIVALAAAGITAGAISCAPNQANADTRIGIYVQGTPIYVPTPVYYTPRPVYVPYVRPYVPQYQPAPYYAPRPVYVPYVRPYVPQYQPAPYYAPRPVYVPYVRPYVPQYQPVQYTPAPVYCAPQTYARVQISPRGVGLQIGGNTPLGLINFGLRLMR